MASVAAQFATRGKKCVAIGRNYAAHIKELNNATPTEPFFFLKPTSSYALSADGKVEIPQGITCHHEVELGVIIGKGGRDITAAQALDHVAGYVRDPPFLSPGVRAYGFDTFCPVGQFIPKDKVQDPHNLRLWYKVNGEVRQNDNTSLMLYRIPELIEHVSSIMTLEEGDLILTGTPKGVSRVVAGDKIEAGLESTDGTLLDHLEHVVKDREGGYHFKANLLERTDANARTWADAEFEDARERRRHGWRDTA
ncbi:hypothetical protein C6P46_004371 [Rhodotorula mucilaginosa]|uniref:Fumarylacetoacetase-like C-terminal domain-containing protein n=1 Tax=Rhodotorula mucilaginosa TaxID=5537 RepID=A0A9P7B6J2_RHOMI|nr:hypothetical protein C6P46_004371 [Rhodotorula mucilaginosa]